MLFFLFFFSLLTSSWAEDTILTRRPIPHAADRLALCGDGTGAFFYANTSNTNPTARWVVHLMGGGACMSNSTCSNRDASLLGSAKTTFPESSLGLAMLSNDPEENPSFFASNKVFVPYCSSDMWMGNSTYEGLHFRGEMIFRAVIEETILASMVNAAGVAVPEEILVLGESAGGWGAAYHINYLVSLFPHSRIMLLTDSSSSSISATTIYSAITASFGSLPKPTIHESVNAAWKPSFEYCKRAQYPIDPSSNFIYPCCFDLMCGIRHGYIPTNVSIFMAQSLFDGLVVLAEVFELAALSKSSKRTQPPVAWFVDALTNTKLYSNMSSEQNNLFSTFDPLDPFRPARIAHAPITFFQPACVLHRMIMVSDLQSKCESPLGCVRDGVKLPLYRDAVFNVDIRQDALTIAYFVAVVSSTWSRIVVQGVSYKQAVTTWASQARANTLPPVTSYFDTCQAPSCNPSCPEDLVVGLQARVGDISGHLFISSIPFIIAVIMICAAQVYDMPRRAARHPVAMVTNRRSMSVFGSSLRLADDTVVDVAASGVDIVLRHVKYTVKGDVTLLHDVCVRIASAELTALMGPSGSGKTTLLDVMACRRKVGSVTGDISYGGVSVGEPGMSQWLQEASGFVRQLDDPSIDHLTLRENLEFAADLRLPASVSCVDRRKRVLWLLRALRMRLFQHVKVGGKQGPCLSGGQRRRLAVAFQLLKNPKVLFLDEPTSGLDSASAMELVSVLASVVQHGRTVVFSVHQPRVEMWNQFHKVIFLAQGKMLYCGSPHEVSSLMTQVLGSPWSDTLLGSANLAHTILDILKDENVVSLLADDYKKNHTSMTAVSHVTISPGELPSYSHLDKIFTLINRGLQNPRASHPILGLCIGTSAMFFVMGLVYFQLEEMSAAFGGSMLCSALPCLIMSTFLGEINNSRKPVFWQEVGDGVVRGWHLMFVTLVEAWASLTLAVFVSSSISYLLIIQSSWYNAADWGTLCICNLTANGCHACFLFTINFLRDNRIHVNTLRMWYVCIAALLGGVMISYKAAPVALKSMMSFNPSFTMNSIAENAMFGNKWGKCDFPDSRMFYCPQSSANFVLDAYSMAVIDGPKLFRNTYIFFAFGVVLAFISIEMRARARVGISTSNLIVSRLDSFAKRYTNTNTPSIASLTHTSLQVSDTKSPHDIHVKSIELQSPTLEQLLKTDTNAEA